MKIVSNMRFINSKYISQTALKLLTLCVLTLTIHGCDDFPNSPELIDKFRAMGVGFADPSYTASTESSLVTAQLEFFFATPSKEEITFVNKDVESLQLDLVFGQAELLEEKASLNIYKVTATALLPTADFLYFNPNADNTADVVYAAIFRQGTEEEQILGRMKIYQPDAAAADTITIPTARITSHSEGDSISASPTTLISEVDNKVTGESYRTSWLVSSGVIDNIRTRESEWTEYASGEATIILTVRGLTSYNFNYTAIDVTVE
jgi:hypothetical protein